MKNLLLFNTQGLPVDPSQPKGPWLPLGGAFRSTTVSSHLFSAYPVIPPGRQYQAAVRGVLDGWAEWSGRQKAAGKPDKGLLLYIHGGMINEAEAQREAQRMLNAGMDGEHYPVFLCWQAGPLTAYLDHLFFVRRGVNWPLGASVTFPFILASDLLRGLADWPLAMAASLSRPLENKLFNTRAGLVAAEEGRAEGVEFEHGPDLWNLRDRFEAGWDLYLPLFWPFKAVTQYLLTALGPPTWNIMRRRTELLFQNEEDSGWSDPEASPRAEAPGGGNGALPVFLRALEAEQTERRKQGLPAEVSLIGHSMGSIIANGILRSFPGLDLSVVAYMAAACTVREYQLGVWPYLAQHPKARFYNLTLNENVEEREEDGFGFLPRGSLLVWIDDYLGSPNDRLDRCAGRLSDFADALWQTPAKLARQVHLKSFPGLHAGAKRDRTQMPQTHDGFRWLRFWEEHFYKPKY
ncbi:MAG TPA: hypothetical protein VK842_05120 [bacterium]|jgi:hypothetical protein|nr:hypothetical protein [bacterium]